MPNLMQGFKQFELNDSQIEMLKSEFELLIPDTNLSRCSRVDKIIKDYKKTPGIYFWVMRYAGEMFRIYIGKTNSMSYRVQNYVSEFQPHSPNDFKLRIFYSFMAEIAPNAALDLYFCGISESNLTHSENLAVTKYDPLLNRRQQASPEARAIVKDAFSVYYRSAFERLLQNDVD